MSKCYKKFGSNDVFYNTIKAHPENEFFVYNSTVYYNEQPRIQGAFTASVPAGIHAAAAIDATAKAGNISLYELNVDREGDTGPESIYPFITKAGSLMSFKTITDSSFNTDFKFGDTLTAAYPLSASIHRRLFSHNAAFRNSDYLSNRDFHLSTTGSALKNAMNNYRVLSPLYNFSRYEEENSGTSEALNLISIPSIFYGSSIKKGSVDLRFYITGTLVGRLQDDNRNGELIQVGPVGSEGSGNVAGVVLYNEGFVLLTGSWDLADGANTIDYNNDGTPVTSSWLYYAVGANDDVPRDAVNDPGAGYRSSASYNLSFEGTSYTPVVTMLAHSEKAEHNHSNNPTYLTAGQSASLTPYSSSYLFRENDLTIKNIVSSSYEDPEPCFDKLTYISKVGIYDEQQNLIAVASLASPVKKKEDQNYTFKLKVDL
mgnify:CR=1 FL=1